MYIYWPVVLIGLTILIVFLPARVLHHRSRKWFAFSNVSQPYCARNGLLANNPSGGFYLLEYTPSSSAISSSAICIVLKLMLWE